MVVSCVWFRSVLLRPCVQDLRPPARNHMQASALLVPTVLSRWLPALYGVADFGFLLHGSGLPSRARGQSDRSKSRGHGVCAAKSNAFQPSCPYKRYGARGFARLNSKGQQPHSEPLSCAPPEPPADAFALDPGSTTRPKSNARNHFPSTPRTREAVPPS
eukprot:253113-Rhodomonas_salina.1